MVPEVYYGAPLFIGNTPLGLVLFRPVEIAEAECITAEYHRQVHVGRIIYSRFDHTTRKLSRC